MKFKSIKDETKILIMLAFFSIAVGLWGNFRQLWLQDNGFQVIQISRILSAATFFCAFCMMLFFTNIGRANIKRLIAFSILFKAINLLVLFKLNGSDMTNIIKPLIMTDIVLEKIILLSIYPFIATIKRDDKLYSKRKLVEYTFRDVGILIAGLFIGKAIAGVMFDYNMSLLIATIVTFVSFIIMIFIKNKENNKDEGYSKGVIKYILKDKVLYLYLIYIFIGQTAYSTALGLKMLIMINVLSFAANTATNYFLIVGLIADAIGVIALLKLTPKNDYLTITIKFGLRFLMYILVAIMGNNIIIISAITVSLLVSTAYENITDAPYLNRISKEYQLLFTNIRFMASVLGETAGLFLSGIMYDKGIRYVFGLSAFFMIFQLTLGYVMRYLRVRNLKNIDIQEEN